MVYGRTMYNLSHILTRYTHMDYNSQVIKGPPPMHMDEQDFQAYIDASVDSSELQNDAEEDEYLTRCYHIPILSEQN